MSEFSNPEVKEEFIQYILSLRPAKERIQTRNFVDQFLEILLNAKQASLQTKFPINLTKFSLWMGIRKDNLERHVLPLRPSRKMKPEFTEKRDFIIISQPLSGKRGPQQRDLYVTIGCFKKLCMQLESEIGHQARELFDLLSDAYLDYFGEAVAHRLREEPREETQYKRENPLEVNVKAEPANYAYKLEYGGRTYVRHGITDDIRTRMKRHEKTMHGVITPLTYRSDPHPQFEEACRDMFVHIRTPCPSGYRCDRCCCTDKTLSKISWMLKISVVVKRKT